jgi:hypothetical protein
MMRSANASINARAPGLRLAGARRQPSPPPGVDAATASRAVLDQIDQAVNVARMSAARHAVTGCPTPDCRPCRAERARQAAEERAEFDARDALARKQAIRQHHESARKLAEMAARRRPRRELTNTKWWPSCAKCSTTLENGTTCRSCGTETIQPRLDVLDAINRPLRRREDH